MKTVSPLLLSVLLAVLLGSIPSCSSAPRPTEEVNSSKNKAVEFTEYGNNYYSQGQFEKAIELFNLALAYNGSVDHQAGMAGSYNSIGRAYLALGRYDDAQSNFDRAEKIGQRINDSNLICQSLNNRGEVFLQRGDYQKALPHFERAVEKFDKGVANSQRAIVYHNLGTNYKRLGEKEKALEYLKLAVKLNLQEKRAEEAAPSPESKASSCLCQTPRKETTSSSRSREWEGGSRSASQ